MPVRRVVLVLLLLTTGLVAAFALGAFSDFRRNHSRYNAAVARARTQLEAAPPPQLVGCDARTASFRTGWSTVLRGGPNSPNVTAWRTARGVLLVKILETDVHGYARAYMFVEPVMTTRQLADFMDACMGEEWEHVSPLTPGWFELMSRLD